MAAPWRSAGRTQQGQARLRNEDAFLDDPRRSCWAVADGMGGYRNGDVASRWVIRQLAAVSAQGNLDQRIQAVRSCLQGVNQGLRRAWTEPGAPADATMGSTVVALLLEKGRAACLWAGDSRCYLWRGQSLYQLSKDHSLLQRLMDERHLSAAQAQAYPDARALTRAVGAGSRLHLEALELSTRPGDVFLLCSDGLYQALSHVDLGRALSMQTPQQAVERLFAGALRRPVHDDLTAVVVQP
ncbi:MULTISPECIES: PP2C family protein-serine/threonine phosphatase [Pseudomonas]|uniref:Protein phosphatase n=1 Tax=Pseudomonas azotoformans TaxID=47878 RepID=A0A4Q0HWI9_PSEAZ|nr:MULTISPECIES: PP2C family serine/threonine-protein phosphatase [Pseudomonas]KRP98319.1 protein phosphatase [Pseudomonas lactis]KWV82640.1 Serine/threonine phosphatase stp [Pseudomonas fluorescens]MBJ2307113.1 serine/threonine-protein phosphatase [Pseudomonas sp. MF2846]MBK3492508.1 serine/threonine-protein phosphatase [Pseudomonas sp. MF2857]MCR8664598.1 serine/threonine-protein phosphatase [Pseudomonas carnis]